MSAKTHTPKKVSTFVPKSVDTFYLTLSSQLPQGFDKQFVKISQKNCGHPPKNCGHQLLQGFHECVFESVDTSQKKCGHPFLFFAHFL